jgi:hypothetical protein
MTAPHMKDEILDELAREFNVAQFVSFGPDLKQRFSRIAGMSPNSLFHNLEEGISTIINRSADGAVNVRSFDADNPRSREFIQGLTNSAVAIAHVARLASQGLTTIVNETIDIADGGVSGVATPETIEFSPDATPRAVEEEGVARLPRQLGNRLLEIVYGFAPEVPTEEDLRIEFSIHPRPRGWLQKHTVLWEREILSAAVFPARATWPNNFSRLLGDKTYGLLMAFLAGLPTPRTTVLNRRVAPFTFGDDTGTHEIWTRTCPARRSPGLFSTVRGWTDPFKLMASEDPYHTQIASVISQAAVPSVFAGAAIAEADGTLRIEGVRGSGDRFMLTGVNSELPQEIRTCVATLNEAAKNVFGPVSFEWVFDGQTAWVVQLHVGQSESQGDVIYPGEPQEWIEISASRSLEQIRDVIGKLDPARTGVVLVGSIGTSSHKGDLLRTSRIPSRLRHPNAA